MNTVITVGREFGSGGREFARTLAEILGFEFYDKEIIAEIAKKTSLSVNYVKEIVERAPHQLFPVTTGNAFAYYSNPAIANKQAIFTEQTNVLREMAEKSSCVIVGRCADYVLKDYKPFKIFVYADEESKLKRCLQRENPEITNPQKIKKQIKKIDKNRASYYSFYTGEKWGYKLNYDLCINTSSVDICSLAKTVAKLFE